MYPHQVSRAQLRQSVNPVNIFRHRKLGGPYVRVFSSHVLHRPRPAVERGGGNLSPHSGRSCFPLFACWMICSNNQVYGVVDEAAHKAAGGLPVVRVAQALIKAPIEEVALCWWQAGRRKVRSGSSQRYRRLPSARRIDLVCLLAVVRCFFRMGT